MRILIVTPLVPPEPGGPSYYSVALKEALIQLGEKVDMIAFREVRKYPSVIRHFMFLYKVLFRARHADVLIILDTVSVAIPAVIAGWLLGKRMVVRVGGDFVWEQYVERTKEKILLSQFYTKIQERTLQVSLSRKERIVIWLQKHIVCKLATHIVFNTEWQRELWKEPYALSLSKTGVIQNATKTNGEKYEGGNAFLCVWRPTAFKNTDTLERAYVLAKETHPQIELNVFKNIPREELFKKMRTARALIIPSLTELSPNMALEALRMGVPVLLSRDCGAYPLLDGHVIWIDPLSEKDIAEKMCALMEQGAYEEACIRAQSFSFVHSYEDIALEFTTVLNG